MYNSLYRYEKKKAMLLKREMLNKQNDPEKEKVERKWSALTWKTCLCTTFLILLSCVFV